MHRNCQNRMLGTLTASAFGHCYESAVWEAELSEKSGDGFDELEATVREEFAKFHE